jgi:ABC-type dipeptide/oligopeptide/nickel transport system ATPase component
MSLINFYELDAVKALQPKTINPNYAKHGLKVPFRMVIVGASGSGKTNIIMNLISITANTFNKIYLYTRNKNEPLYEYLELAIPDTAMLEVHEGIEHLKSINIDKHFFGQTLIIFDDLCQEKDQTFINELYLRGRKLGICICYLTQKYVLTPSVVRANANYLILKKINGKRDVVEILKNGSITAERDELLRMYAHVVSGDDILSFLMIDFDAKGEHQYRHNFDRILNLDFFK